MSDYQLQPYSEDVLPAVISPEGAEIANAYLTNACSLKCTSDQLDLPTYEISAILQQPMIKTYINGILKENGFRHMEKIASKLDELIDMKWDELAEAEIGSNKDIADLLLLAHKMRTDMVNILQKSEIKADSHIKNTQVNVYGEGAYGRLMEKLIG